MKLGGSKYLGLALGDRSIVAAQVKVARDRRELSAAAEFAFGASVSWEDPAALGRALRHFLRQNGFSASRVVVGVPARWLMARQREVPPASAAIAASTLRLHAERDFPSDLELVYDFAGQSDAQKAQRVLLAAMPRRHMDRIQAMADESGLNVVAVTSSSLALASSTDRSAGDVLSLVVGGEAAEMVICGESAPRLLKHLGACSADAGNGHTASTMAMLGGEVQRALAMLPRDAEAGRLAGALLWDGVGMGESAADVLASRGGVVFGKNDDLATLGVVVERAGLPQAGRMASAVALALVGAKGGLAIDFLHTRLAPPRARRVNRQQVLAVAAIVVVVGALLGLWVDVLRKEAAVTAVRDQIKAEEKKKEDCKAVREKAKVASGWFDERPGVMGCLRELTLLFPADGRIVATSFAFHEDGKVEVGARTPEQSLALELGDKLRNNKSFADVVLPSLGDLAGRSREAPFIVKFTYVGKE